MRIAIIDDDNVFQINIINELSKQYEVKDIDVYESIHDYLVGHRRYDIILLDIQLKEENGLEYIKQHSFHTYVIFLSFHTEFVYECFHKDVVGFVPKQRIKERLLLELKKVEERLLTESSYTFETAESSIRIRKSDILFFEFVSGSVYLHVKTQKQPIEIFEKSMSHLEKHLDDDFMRVSRTHIAHVAQIDKVKKTLHLIVYQGKPDIKVSERCWGALKKHYHILRSTYDLLEHDA